MLDKKRSDTCECYECDCEECDCNCHKENAVSNLKKCQETSKKKSKEIGELKKKLMIVTIAIAVAGTLMGKGALDKVLSYFESVDKLKSTIDSFSKTDNDDVYEFPLPVYYGTSPSPSALTLFALTAFVPTQRRK